jgi:hypothetical protein
LNVSRIKREVSLLHRISGTGTYTEVFLLFVLTHEPGIKKIDEVEKTSSTPEEPHRIPLKKVK